MAQLTRRSLLGLGAGIGAAAGGAAAAAAAVAAAGGAPSARTDLRGALATPTAGYVPFHGPQQAGIATPVQDRLHMVAFDLTTSSRAGLTELLHKWTEAAAAMTSGDTVGLGAIPEIAEAPPDDTGEAVGLPASRLTLTIGFGPGVFERDGADRFGLRDQRPAGLIDLPHFAGDQLDPARSGGDVVIQACADDPQVAVHAVRDLARIAFGSAAVRWAQLGFGKTSSTTPSTQTPRNLFGFKDGTNNIAGSDVDALREHVWVNASADRAPAWMDGGSYLVARRIAMRIETWDRTSLAEQQTIVGRSKGSGAPLDGAKERDDVHVGALPADSHVRLAHPDMNGGRRILRRGYSFVDGADGLGRLDAGLFFIAFCRDPRTQYVPLQQRLADNEAMAEYIVHTGSGLWAVPAGVQPGQYWGQALLEA